MRHASIVQWIEQETSKLLMEVRFLLEAQTNKVRLGRGEPQLFATSKQEDESKPMRDSFGALRRTKIFTSGTELVEFDSSWKHKRTE
jgi:hypothetical protein